MKKVLLALLCSSVVGCATLPKQTSMMESSARRPASELSTPAPTAAHDALNGMGRHLRGREKGVHYLGSIRDGELCEVWIRENYFAFIRTNKGALVSADNVYGPSYGITEDKSEIEMDSVTVEPSSNLEIAAVTVSSGIDNSRAEFVVRHDKSAGKDLFVSGLFKFRHGSASEDTCDLKHEILDQSATGQPVLTDTRAEDVD
jgi:hypothetical protein